MPHNIILYFPVYTVLIACFRLDSYSIIYKILGYFLLYTAANCLFITLYHVIYLLFWRTYRIIPAVITNIRTEIFYKFFTFERLTLIMFRERI